MTDYKFCDLHKNEENRRQPKESMRTIRVEQWQKIRGSNRLFENKLDVCLACLSELVISRAKGLKIDYENNWRTEVWQTGKTGRRFKSMMSADEYMEFLDQEEKERELAELRARAK